MRAELKSHLDNVTLTTCVPNGLFNQTTGPYPLRQARQIAIAVLQAAPHGASVIIWDAEGCPEESIKLPMEGEYCYA